MRAPTAAAIQADLFAKACNFSSCHSSVGHMAGLVLVDLGTACKNLINVPAMTPGAAAQGLLRVLPGDPENSFLYQKLAAPEEDLNEFMGEALGARMPRCAGCEPLDAATLATIAKWISDGAACP